MMIISKATWISIDDNFVEMLYQTQNGKFGIKGTGMNDIEYLPCNVTHQLSNHKYVDTIHYGENNKIM